MPRTSLLKFTSIVIFACFFVLSCGDDDPNGVAAPAPLPSDDIGDVNPPPVESFSLTDGWQSACRNERFDGFGVASMTERYEFADRLAKITILYAADGCTEPVVEVRETGAYSLTDPSVEAISQLDLVFDSVSVKPLTANARNALRAIQACQTTEWMTNQSRDVTAATSNDPTLDRCWVLTPRAVYDIASVSRHRLLIGTEETGGKTSPETRPATLDQEHVFHRD